MEPVLNGLGWLALVGAVFLGAQGALLSQISVTGVVLAPALLWVALRHGRVAPRLLWGGLSCDLPMESWPEAREVILDLRLRIWICGLVIGVVGIAQLLWLPAGDQVAATIRAATPFAFAWIFNAALLSPLEQHLLVGYQRWIQGLKEALTPPEHEEIPVVRRIA